MREGEPREREQGLDELTSGYLAYYAAGKEEKYREFLGKIREWAEKSPARYELARKTISEELRERQRRQAQAWEAPTDPEALRELRQELFIKRSE